MKDYSSMTREELEQQMTDKQRRFCEEYVVDWNASRASRDAGYKPNAAQQTGAENLKKPVIQAYIDLIKSDLSRLSGVTALRNIRELAKLAYSSVSSFKSDWMTQKEFKELTPDQKACISEISYVERTTKFGNETIVKFKLYDKIQAIKELNNMLGHNAPTKTQTDLTSGGKPIKINPISFIKQDGSE